MAIIFKNVKKLDGTIEDHTIASEESREIDCQGRLTLLPALIDPHVHFRTPGAEHKEEWRSGARAAIAGGVTTVFDMPNTSPSCTSYSALKEKKALIDQQLKEAGIPLHYELYFGADKNSLHELNKVKKEVIGLKIYMGSTTGDLLMDDDAAIEEAFRVAAQQDVMVAVHAEDEGILEANKKTYQGPYTPAAHSKIRSREAAILATKKAIALAEKYSARLAILHVSTKEEVDLIRAAKQRELLVYMEVSPHHLFLTDQSYEMLGTKLQMNPPIRTAEDVEALWDAIEEGVVDFIGSDHAPHTLEEKDQCYGKAPSGVPGIETLLPLLLNAYNEGKISLEKIITLTNVNIVQIFNLHRILDVVVVDLELVRIVDNKNLKTKCGWSPFEGYMLKGWPLYTVCQGRLFECGKM